MSTPGLIAQELDDETQRFLYSMNKQVAFMNKTDAELMPVFRSLTELNAKMIEYVDEDDNIAITYSCQFEAPETRYKQATYQKLNIPAEFRPEVVGRMETLMDHLREIARMCNELEVYMRTSSYKTDNMYQGFKFLKELDRKLRQYLVAHEAWHAALTTSWSTHFLQRQGRRSPPVVVRMERALTTAHVVYLDLGYDPDYTDSKRHFKELGESLELLKSQMADDPDIADNRFFKAFIEPLPANYLDNFGSKGSLDFYRKFNSKYVGDVNNRYIDNFNQFVNDKGYPVLNASREPPFFVYMKPDADVETLIDEPVAVPEPEPEPIDTIVSEPIAEPEPLTPVITPPEPEVPKPSKLEGYAPNNLVFLIDVSGSMRQSGRLDTLKSSFRYLLEEMRPKDKVSIVTYSGDAMVRLKPTSATQRDRILAVINNLKSEGKSNVNLGLILGFQQADLGFHTEGNNRIILVTDGFISYNKNSENLIKKSSEDKQISLSVFFFGNAANPNIEVARLRSLANWGNGNFITVSRTNARASMLEEAQAVKELE